MTLTRRRLVENGPGVAGSAVLHGLVLLLALVWYSRVARLAEPAHSVLVDIVHLGERTASPLSTSRSPIPAEQASARRERTAHSPPTGVSPKATRAPDELENRLHALAKLKSPETDPRLLTGNGTVATETASNGAPTGSDAAYGLSDYVRAQVLRRWNLDLDAPGAQRIVVALHVTMKADGTIARAEIVDRARYASDLAFRRIALSARNAALLASPITLPPGRYAALTEMTLRLDPRDALK